MRLVRFLSRVYGCFGCLRRFFFKVGLFSRRSLPVPVVSVGNITSGGVGKTPFTVLLCSVLQDEIPICTLSRGYRAEAEKKNFPTVVSKWGKISSAASTGGDEPQLLASRLKKCSVISGRNRYEGGKKAIEIGARLLVLDDGFQHLQLHRDYDIVIIDAVDPWGGFLRELSFSLKEANFIAITQGDQISDQKLTDLMNEIKQLTDAPMTAFCLDEPCCLDEKGNRVPLKGKKVIAACGIARPHRFVETLKQAGAEVVACFSWPDHTHPVHEELRAFVEQVNDADLVLFTEKDWVRFPQKIKFPLMSGYVCINLVPYKQKESFSLALKQIEKLRIRP